MRFSRLKSRMHESFSDDVDPRYRGQLSLIAILQPVQSCSIRTKNVHYKEIIEFGIVNDGDICPKSLD
jgi:hypothetical protein